jgi:hypothetical protein
LHGDSAQTSPEPLLAATLVLGPTLVVVAPPVPLVDVAPPLPLVVVAPPVPLADVAPPPPLADVAPPLPVADVAPPLPFVVEVVPELEILLVLWASPEVVE